MSSSGSRNRTPSGPVHSVVAGWTSIIIGAHSAVSRCPFDDGSSRGPLTGLIYYRLWGDRGGPLDYSGAYCIHTDPGNAPVPRVDGRGERYWETVRDL